ncbi:MAG TPA: ATP-binding cassette domain-containing protein [Acidimicrobiia bacterium]|nr:ATP-binding cassette domain-containing protein [Acidimicrobiia bacterium]
MLNVEGLSKRFGPVVALDDVSFSVGRGEIVGFLGPNGAGKTTTMRAIIQLVALDGGAVRWDGAPVTAAIRRRFGYMPAERGMYPRMKVRDHLVYYGRLSGLTASDAAAEADGWLLRLGLSDRADNRVESLSSGNQQRVQLALALLGAPEVLVLDEPFSGLDPLAVDLLGAILHEQVARGAALLLSSHQLDLVADACTAVVIVDRGRVVLRGDVASLRAASPTRYVDVEFAAPTAWNPPGVTLNTGDRRRYRARLTRSDDGHALIAAARGYAEVTAYSFATPDLSEVFREAVGRSPDDAAEVTR